MAIEGVDVSHHEGAINWKKARDVGIQFALIKATEGGTFVDPKAQTNLARCREAGIVPGMYHFYRHDVKPEVQAEHFLQHLGSPEAGDLPPAIDVEAPGDGAGPINYSHSEVVKRIGEVVGRVIDKIGRAPMIYTYPYAWKELTNNAHDFAETCPLWIASYGVASPTLVGGWTSWAVWQYTAQGTVSGIGSGVDRDRFNGDHPALSEVRVGALTAGAGAILNEDGNVRQSPGLGADVTTALSGGTRVAVIGGPVLANGREWWQVDDGAGVTGWVSGRLLGPA